ncbi:hypothetical protein IWW36_001622 [Coemansia brasiliensis]|uniref:Amino acid transporter transmembrane domain-containing protein n=1 Tax=Coemansia brasiliensis TaxID=2650707 RepID=A0A9W8M1V0_9FUNG|nr:hypothetical protein IWW36_001622 [Coemansia brasiliensis]
MDNDKGKAASTSTTESEPRLPSNAHSRNNGGRAIVMPQATRKSSMTIARATDRLASLPSSLPRSLPLDDMRSVASSTDEGDSAAAMARRLKRHLVTRSAAEDSKRTSVSSASGRGKADEDGYAGDYNSEDDDNAGRVPVDPLTLPSGDITYGIYRWHQAHESTADSASAHRRGSFSGVASDSEWDVPYSQRQMNMPGGFRRQFLHHRAEREGRPPVAMLTENFVDFINLYGHFAGEDYASDIDDTEDEMLPSPRAPLLRRRQQQRKAALRSIHATASSRKAFFLLLKAFVGTGVLVLPRAFANGGLLASAGVVALVAWYAWHCMILLGYVYVHVGGSYSQIGAKLFGPWAGKVVTVSIATAQLGFCSAYTIFVATNARSVWNALTGCRYNFSSTFWVLIQLLAYIPLAWVRKIKQFAPFALIANACIMSGLGYVLLYDIGEILSKGVADIVQYNPLRFPLLVGTAVFAFEGITLVIPVVDSMKHQEMFPHVMSAVMLVCIVIFCGIAALSYMAFGNSVETVILLNLPDGAPTIVVQLLYSLAIMLSVPLQLYPAVRIFEDNLFSHSGKGNPVVKWEKNLFRTMLTAVVASIAIFGAEQLDNFIAIIGAFACTPLSFIYPAMMHFKISQGQTWTRIKDVMLAIIGGIIMVYVTYIGIASWGASPPAVDQCSAQP